MTSPIIIALDFPNKKEAFELLSSFEKPLFVKVGMELFYREGPPIISELKDKGHHIFLDLKLHDIPSTVYKSMKNLGNLGVDIVNVHAAGGIEMMEVAKEGLVESSGENQPMCIAVTQLTSTSEEVLHDQLLIKEDMNTVVSQYARHAQQAGLDGVVCSPLEVGTIKEVCGSSFKTVTPGIRLSNDNTDDQKRITTPKDAKKCGSDFIVVGRSITQADSPATVYQTILNQWTGVLT